MKHFLKETEHSTFCIASQKKQNKQTQKTTTISPCWWVIGFHVLQWACIMYFYFSFPSTQLKIKGFCMKFSFRVRKTFTENFPMLQQTEGKIVWTKQNVTSGTSITNQEEHLPKMMSYLDGTYWESAYYVLLMILALYKVSKELGIYNFMPSNFIKGKLMIYYVYHQILCHVCWKMNKKELLTISQELVDCAWKLRKKVLEKKVINNKHPVSSA